jgi:hypothetical protein
LLAAVRGGTAGGALSGQIGVALADLGRALQTDQRLALLVNRFARRTLVGVASRYGSQIVRLVSETIRRWDARTVTARIEGRWAATCNSSASTARWSAGWSAWRCMRWTGRYDRPTICFDTPSGEP